MGMKFHMIPALNTFEKVIRYESTRNREIVKSKKMLKMA